MKKSDFEQASPQDSELRVCQVVASINQDVGGPAVSVPHLAESLARCGVRSHLATLNYQLHGPQPELSEVTLINVKAGTSTRRFRGWSRTFQNELMRLAGNGLDVVHTHGMWMLPNLYARRTANESRIPLVISPRGMLEGWSLKRSRLRKFLAWHLYESANLSSAKLFHATSEKEAVSLRAFGLRQPIAVVSNGVDMPSPSAIKSRAVLESNYPELIGKAWLLFFSRLHEVKGIDQLLTVWGELSRCFPDWHLLIAGPDLNGYGETMRRKSRELGITRSVTFTGVLSGDDKECALTNSELFVLPTRSENFGLTVAEALAHRTPVVTTKAAPWSSLSEHKCGWWIDQNERELAAVLENAMTLSATERREMGERGRRLVERNFSWDRVGKEMLATYLWLVERGPRPACVTLS